ncbi:hypothetical protein CcCBS67573_g01088 [Chytriomyces confervae]|uniref:Cullin N-terminal domain-containing protein n=1 Tax=Chytriomyces confervae TaxID=246404 RepID=A0A507FRU1_9FUNG|nr:hypothetical protein HDU80_001889 [Chytriomyces hyalinus]TPX77647.1 hypothetical protein CcCBS67573_g01088 [Chytriomyces confervae]
MQSNSPEWLQLKDFLECVMDVDSPSETPLAELSFETLYRHVHHLCLRPSSKAQLRSDFVDTLEVLLTRQAQSLQPEQFELFITRFAEIVNRSVWASSVVRDVFLYFERIQSRGDTMSATVNIRALVLSAVKTIIIDPQRSTLFEALGAMQLTQPEYVPLGSENLRLLLSNLLAINPDYMSLNIPLYDQLLPLHPKPENFMLLQAEFARAEALHDISQIRAFSMEPATNELWGVYKDIVCSKKRGSLETSEEPANTPLPVQLEAMQTDSASGDVLMDTNREASKRRIE